MNSTNKLNIQSVARQSNLRGKIHDKNKSTDTTLYKRLHIQRKRIVLADNTDCQSDNLHVRR